MPRPLGTRAWWCWANVSQLQRSQLNELQTFVKDGGGLMIFGGDQPRPTVVQMSTRCPTACCRLAWERWPISGTDPEPSTRMVVQRFDHPGLESFQQSAQWRFRRPPRCASGIGR